MTVGIFRYFTHEGGLNQEALTSDLRSVDDQMRLRILFDIATSERVNNPSLNDRFFEICDRHVGEMIVSNRELVHKTAGLHDLKHTYIRHVYQLTQPIMRNAPRPNLTFWERIQDATIESFDMAAPLNNAGLTRIVIFCGYTFQALKSEDPYEIYYMPVVSWGIGIGVTAVWKAAFEALE